MGERRNVWRRLHLRMNAVFAVGKSGLLDGGLDRHVAAVQIAPYKGPPHEEQVEDQNGDMELPRVPNFTRRRHKAQQKYLSYLPESRQRRTLIFCAFSPVQTRQPAVKRDIADAAVI
jgi:hypothetical protein